MVEPITLQYMGDAGRRGGRPEVDKEVEILVFWDETIRNSGNSRMLDLGVDVKVTFLFEDPTIVTKIIPKKVYVTNSDGELFQVVDSIPVSKGFNLESTYDLLLKRVRNYD